MKDLALRAFVEGAEETTTAANLIGDEVNLVLGLDAQVRQNLPAYGNLADSQPFIDSFVRSPMTGCTSRMDKARLDSGFNPLDAARPENVNALRQYVTLLATRDSPLFVLDLLDQQEVHRKDSDWNLVIDQLVALYPVASPAQREEIRQGLIWVINAAATAGSVASLQLISQHSLQTGAESIGVFIYISKVRFEKLQDGKTTTTQLDFVIHRAILRFQAHLWNELYARQTAERHFKSLVDWLQGMNSTPRNQTGTLSCLRTAGRRPAYPRTKNEGRIKEMTERKEPQWQRTPESEPSTIVESPNPKLRDEDILSYWDEETIARAVPTPLPRPTFPSPRRDRIGEPENQPNTFVPPYIAPLPYSSMCKVYYRNGGNPYVASGWIVHGNNNVKGIITSGHVVYDKGQWSKSYLVRRQYVFGGWAEEFTSNFARTLKGWMAGTGLRQFWDLGAIIPSVPIPATTPSLAAIWSYNYNQDPFKYYYDVGYPAKPANGYPFDGEIMWQSDGSLIAAHRLGDEVALHAYNAMEQGSSGSPWMIYDALSQTFYVAGMQAAGWDGIPSSSSPYFEQRNIVSLLKDINVLR